MHFYMYYFLNMCRIFTGPKQARKEETSGTGKYLSYVSTSETNLADDQRG